MGYCGRLHIVPVGVLGEENSAPQYVHALVVQKNGVGFLNLVEGDEIEPDAGTTATFFNVTRTLLHGFPYLSQWRTRSRSP